MEDLPVSFYFLRQGYGRFVFFFRVVASVVNLGEKQNQQKEPGVPSVGWCMIKTQCEESHLKNS